MFSYRLAQGAFQPKAYGHVTAAGHNVHLVFHCLLRTRCWTTYTLPSFHGVQLLWWAVGIHSCLLRWNVGTKDWYAISNLQYGSGCWTIILTNKKATKRQRWIFTKGCWEYQEQSTWEEVFRRTGTTKKLSLTTRRNRWNFGKHNGKRRLGEQTGSRGKQRVNYLTSLNESTVEQK